GHLPRRAAAVLPPRAVHASAAQRQDRDPAHLRLACRRLRAGPLPASTMGGAGGEGASGPPCARHDAAAGAGTLGRGMAGPAAHLLLPRLRDPRRDGPADLLTAGCLATSTSRS